MANRSCSEPKKSFQTTPSRAPFLDFVDNLNSSYLVVPFELQECEELGYNPLHMHASQAFSSF